MKKEDKVPPLPKKLFLLSNLAKNSFTYDENYHIVVKPGITVAVHSESIALIQKASEAS